MIFSGDGNKEMEQNTLFALKRGYQINSTVKTHMYHKFRHAWCTHECRKKSHWFFDSWLQSKSDTMMRLPAIHTLDMYVFHFCVRLWECICVRFTFTLADEQWKSTMKCVFTFSSFHFAELELVMAVRMPKFEQFMATAFQWLSTSSSSSSSPSSSSFY